MKDFTSLGLIEPLKKAVEELKFTTPTIIQAKSIPAIIDKKDVIAQSATGSGKTLAFGLGLMQHIQKGEGIQSLILTPTRELAVQVGQVLKQVSRHHPVKVAIVYGGVSINPQIDALTRADIVVGTPGRILDHLERKTLNLSKVAVLVLDEADRMLDMGFIEDVEKIISQCPRQRQTLLFSATISYDVRKLAKKYMHSPLQVSGQEIVEPGKLDEVYYDVDSKKKVSLLIHLLKQEEQGLVMVFCNTRKSADIVARNLKPHGVNALAIHGGLSQSKRSQVMEAFHSQKVTVLVCTDVAARGLDIQNVSHVYNFDIPADSKEYIHRIGRTARAGKEGKIVNLISDRDHDNFSRVLWDTKRDIKKTQTPNVPFLRVQWNSPRDRRSRGPPRGPRRSSGPRKGPRRGPSRSSHGGNRPRGRRQGYGRARKQ